MKAAFLLLAIAVAAGPTAAAAPAPGPLYGDTVLRAALTRFPAVAGLSISATAKDGATIALSTGGPAGAAQLPLEDAMGTTIGSVSIATARGKTVPASVVVAWLSRRIYVADNLREPDPFVPGTRRSPRAQALVERTIDRFPDLVTLAMHVAPPGRPNTIIASSFGRIGKPADKDDAHVIADGAVLREVTNGGTRLAVELPMTDAKGRTIGALSTSFRAAAGTDPQSLYPRAVQVRDALARRTPSVAWLTAPR